VLCGLLFVLLVCILALPLMLVFYVWNRQSFVYLNVAPMSNGNNHINDGLIGAPNLHSRGGVFHHFCIGGVQWYSKNDSQMFLFLERIVQ